MNYRLDPFFFRLAASRSRAGLLLAYLLLGCLLLACAPFAWSQQPPAPGSEQFAKEERARITAQRESIEKRFATEEAACYKRFSVNDCLLESKGRRREALADLRRQEVSLNDAERKKRGADQTRKVEDRLSTEKTRRTDEERSKAEDARLHREQAAQQNAARREQQKAKADEPASHARQQSQAERHAQGVAAREKMAAQSPANVKQHEGKLKDAAEYKARRQEKIQKKTKPAAQPLPPPPS